VEARLSALEASLAAQDDANTFRAYWKDGFNLEAGAAKLKLGGRVMWDLFWVSEDDDMKTLVGAQPDGTEFRRLRLFNSGQVGEHVTYKIQIDFAGGGVDIKDAYVGLRKVPGVQNVRFGHFKEFMGLEELTSSKYISFMERSVTSSLAPSRNSGIGVHGVSEDEKINWGAGIFKNVGSSGKTVQDGNNALTARIAGRPMWNSKTDFLHLGAAVSWRNKGASSYSLRPENHLGSSLFSVMTTPKDQQILYGIEAAWMKGPLSFQAEFIGTSVDGATGSQDMSINSFYLFGSYFLSDGDHRGYKASSGTFSRVKPKNPLSLGGENTNLGAWEGLIRYSWIDGEGDNGAGAKAESTNMNLTVGLNWYWNNNARWMLNYVYSTLDNGAGSNEGTQHALQMRWQIDF
jgi:phosphate-selective porin OprO/OprP